MNRVVVSFSFFFFSVWVAETHLVAEPCFTGWGSEVGQLFSRCMNQSFSENRVAKP